MIMYECKDRDLIRSDGKFIGKVGYKPYSAFITIFVFALLLLILRNTAAYIASALLFLLAVAGLVFIKDRPILEVYDDCVIIHDEKDSLKAIRIPLSEITKWETSRNSSFQTVLYTIDKDQPVLSFECFSIGNVNYLLKQVMYEKQSTELGMRKRKDKKL